MNTMKNFAFMKFVKNFVFMKSTKKVWFSENDEKIRYYTKFFIHEKVCIKEKITL